MTDRPRPGRPSAAPVFWVSTLLFAALFAFLVYRFSAGEDPSLASVTAPRPVELRKVIKRKVVTTVVPGAGRNRGQRAGHQRHPGRRSRPAPNPSPPAPPDSEHTMNEHDLTFDAMGSHVRLLIGEPGPAGPSCRRRPRPPSGPGASSTSSTPPSPASSPTASSAR